MKIRGRKISVRLPLPKQIGGVHKPKKGGYNRQRDRKKPIRDWQKHGE